MFGDMPIKGDQMRFNVKNNGMTTELRTTVFSSWHLKVDFLLSPPVRSPAVIGQSPIASLWPRNLKPFPIETKCVEWEAHFVKECMKIHHMEWNYGLLHNQRVLGGNYWRSGDNFIRLAHRIPWTT